GQQRRAAYVEFLALSTRSRLVAFVAHGGADRLWPCGGAARRAAGAVEPQAVARHGLRYGAPPVSGWTLPALDGAAGPLGVLVSGGRGKGPLDRAQIPPADDLVDLSH